MSRKIEIRTSGTSAMPGSKGGQHTNVSTLWFREGSSRWGRVGWTRSAAQAMLAVVRMLKSASPPEADAHAAARAERAAVVDWIRRQGDVAIEVGGVRELADAIDRGEHVLS